MTYQCICDFDRALWTNIRNIKASRRERKCCECGAPIGLGQPYRSTVGKWNSTVSTYVWCNLCADLCDWAIVSVPCFCWLYENLHEDIRAMVGEVRHEVQGFFFEYGRRVVRIRLAGGHI